MISSENSHLPFLPEEKYMQRAIQLAKYGEYHASPNPMVGAVIVARERIIGEGWHRKCGEPHAEVNAVNSVNREDIPLLRESTIYVTLEPCAHYGKTPPCAQLIIDREIPRIVAGSIDPFSKVAGQGVKMLRDAGREVISGYMEKECKALNPHFFTAHTLQRPYILLKWAESADRKIAGKGEPVILSNSLSLPVMHSVRAHYDAIMVGTDTLLTDNPSLTTRLWAGESPRPVIFNSPRLKADLNILKRNPIILDSNISLSENMHDLYKNFGITSLMVEGGAKLLQSFIDTGLFDEIRIETSPIIIGEGIAAPALPRLRMTGQTKILNNLITSYKPV